MIFFVPDFLFRKIYPSAERLCAGFAGRILSLYFRIPVGLRCDGKTEESASPTFFYALSAFRPVGGVDFPEEGRPLRTCRNPLAESGDRMKNAEFDAPVPAAGRQVIGSGGGLRVYVLSLYRCFIWKRKEVSDEANPGIGS